MTVWIDVDNSPQARYLLPLVPRFEKAGHNVLLTARADGDTFAILRSEGATFEPVGSSFGKGVPRKLYGLAKRARQLLMFLERRAASPSLVITGSRSAAVAARRLSIPSFVIADYEHVNLLVYRLAKSHIVHPNVIHPTAFERQGIARQQLIPFDGLKEDIAFADADFDLVPPHEFDDGDPSAARVLFRPPAEESHYYRSESRDLALELLRFLATEHVRVVFSPRYDGQIGYLDEVPSWKEEPVILREPVPVVALLKGVDAVVSAGGTMLREAAYVGVPAYSIFRGDIGAVDRYLASINRLTLVASAADFSRIEASRKGPISPLRRNSTTAEEVTNMILDRVSTATNGHRQSASRDFKPARS
jgi:uncharacterized protein